jgi:hypothetical protein
MKINSKMPTPPMSWRSKKVKFRYRSKCIHTDHSRGLWAVGVFEFEVDEEGDCSSKVWEWK